MGRARQLRYKAANSWRGRWVSSNILENGSAHPICWMPATPVAICFQTSFEIMGKQVAGIVDKPRLNLGSNAGPKAVNAGSKLVGRISSSAKLPPANITGDRFNVAPKCIHDDKSSSVESSSLLIPISDQGASNFFGAAQGCQPDAVLVESCDQHGSCSSYMASISR